jgi:hypothetical protein
MSSDIVTRDATGYLPAMTTQQAWERRAAMVEFVKAVMVEGVDYGTIPGASKPSLQKPGAEKLSTLFGLTPTFHRESVEMDWTGRDHGGELFFLYDYKCKLWRGDVLMGEGEGSCNSWETKYRYRQAERSCPNCSKPTIRKSKPRDGDKAPPGWYCWAKIGGCGAQFKAGDAAIEQQQTGRTTNPDPADQVNTICKMAQKRAFVAAVLVAVNASEFFTQDLEDFAPEHAPAPVVVVDQATHEQSGATYSQERKVLLDALRMAVDEAIAAGADIKRPGQREVASWDDQTVRNAITAMRAATHEASRRAEMDAIDEAVSK